MKTEVFNFGLFSFILIDYKIYNSVNELPNTWNTIPSHDVFFKTSFLKGLESSSPSNITSYYLGVFKEDKLVGIAIIQQVEMYVDVFRSKSNSVITQIGKKLISKIVKGNALVVGNLMHTGQHGLYFNQEGISENDYLETIQKAIQSLTIQIKKQHNKKVRIVAFKDYFEFDSIHKCTTFLKNQKLYKIQVQPNMIFPVLWKTPEDYILSFNKKYSRRYKTARKKLEGLKCRELDIAFVENNCDAIYKLYETVSNNAKINSFKLPQDHFLSLKQHLKNNFKLFGFFLNEELVGFYSLILNYDTLETYFLGYNKGLQRKHQMYLNMLFNMACFGIENGFKSIVYARTAMEIKNSIGAKPNTMHIYLKHTNNFIANTLLKCVVKYMNPIQKWEERNPFKK